MIDTFSRHKFLNADRNSRMPFSNNCEDQANCSRYSQVRNMSRAFALYLEILGLQLIYGGMNCREGIEGG